MSAVLYTQGLMACGCFKCGQMFFVFEGDELEEGGIFQPCGCNYAESAQVFQEDSDRSEHE